MVVDTELYNILGVSPTASDDEIRKAYLQKARELHPDKNQNDPKATEKFQELKDAYDVLKDPKKRSLYDKFGKKGLKGDIGFNPFRPSGPPRPQKTENIVYRLQVTLEDLYNGKNVKLQINRNIICPDCKGNGCQQGKTPQKCPECNGTGKKAFIRRLGPIVTQQVSKCPSCNGLGEHIDPADKCLKCGGKKVVSEKKQIEVHVQPGMEDGDKIPFIGCSDEKPDFETGDVIVILRMKPHPNFLRKHDDLLIEKKISLSEALLGCSFIVNHLDGRKLVVETSKSEVIVPDSVKVIQREGMPQRGNQFEKGKLYIKFTVEFPTADQLSEKLRGDLAECLPPLNSTEGVNMDDEDVYKVGVEDANIKQFQNARSSYNERREEAYNTNDNDRRRNQCQPM